MDVNSPRQMVRNIIILLFFGTFAAAQLWPVVSDPLLAFRMFLDGLQTSPLIATGVGLFALALVVFGGRHYGPGE